MKITAIKAVKRNKNRSSVFIDGKFALSLGNSVVSKCGLKEGYILDRFELDDIIKHKEEVKAMDYALLVLTYRQRSIDELNRKMEKKGYDRDIIKKVRDSLKAEGKLGDREFSLWWIKQRRSGRPKGDIAIKSELREKGVKEKTVTEALAEANSNRVEDELELAWRACRSRLDGYRRLPGDKACRRLKALLGRRGFSFEVIGKVLDKFRGH
ncbi:MAG: RecX family transcriptional regulator [Elusimicrobia bacterium]|nr:RecX family transcriptional regulator [Elusimicrobiota bacterium]